MSVDSQYLRFERETPRAGRKTPVVRVYSERGALLGTIRWFGRWRQYCFWPEPATVFNTGCMTDVQAQIEELHAERRPRAAA